MKYFYKLKSLIKFVAISRLLICKGSYCCLKKENVEVIFERAAECVKLADADQAKKIRKKHL